MVLGLRVTASTVSGVLSLLTLSLCCHSLTPPSDVSALLSPGCHNIGAGARSSTGSLAESHTGLSPLIYLEEF